MTMIKVVNTKTGQTLLLSQEQYNRFFDNRNPLEWKVSK